MDEEEAVSKIRGPINEKLKQLADRDFPQLDFGGTLFKSVEAGGRVWKIRSRPEGFIRELRREIRVLAETLNFEVQGLIEPEDEVHIVLRGRWKHVEGEPTHSPPQDNFRITFDKLGFRRRVKFGTGSSEPFGTINGVMNGVNFGPSRHVIGSEGKPHRKKGSLMFDPSDRSKWPLLPPSSNAATGPRSRTGLGAQPEDRVIVELHGSTTMPLGSDEEVAMVASLLEANRAVPQHHAMQRSRRTCSTSSLLQSCC
eukprot:gb/GFBE01011395.1/.p1 GENE.gb/GFBE01011395.1/~~gb/GFBE01011395.1/.p1  ORF type:complete len:255 (+),score=46.63 gb/GFBE01011395.1/:1-765(+)